MVNGATAEIAARLQGMGGEDDHRLPADVANAFEAALNDMRRALAPKIHEAAQLAADAALQQARDAVLQNPTTETINHLDDAVRKWRRAHDLPDASRVPSADEVAIAMTAAGPLAHVETPFPTLNRATRGGLLMSRMHMVGGEPDAGKTAFVAQLALFWARAGFAVVFLCADEPRESIMDRLGQAFGLALEDLEARKPPVMKHLAERLAELPNLRLVDQRRDRMGVREAALELGRLAATTPGCRGKILVADSLQTVRAWPVDQRPREKRERVELAVAVLLDIATEGALVVATSELNRSAYRAKKKSDRVREIAAFKETGDIEYAMTTGLVLTADKDDREVARVGMGKNKRGLYLPFRVRRDLDRCTFEDMGALAEDEAPEERPVLKPRETTAPAPPLAERARHVLRAQGPIGRETWVCAVGKAATARRAIRWLEEQEEVREIRKGKKVTYVWKDPKMPAEPEKEATS